MGSWVRSGVLSAALVFSITGSSSLFAQDEAAASGAGDPARGKALAYTCLGCHGIPGYKNAYPNYSVPKLEGQHPEYIVAALQAYKNGDRSHMTMHSQASSLTDQEMADVAAYFAGPALKPTGAQNANPPQAATQCVACHGADGIGIVAQYPTLSGQHADYLARALQDYKTGARKNPVMATFAQALKPEDIDALAEYYSTRQPGLKTVERPYTRVSSRP
jgi:cytochrome c553